MKRNLSWWNRLVFLASLGLCGCAHNDWKSLAVQCADTLETVKPAVVSCAAHMKKDHPGHYLSEDGELRIRSR